MGCDEVVQVCIDGIEEIRRAIMLGSLVLAPKKSPMGEDPEEDWDDCKDVLGREEEEEEDEETDSDSAEGEEGEGGDKVRANDSVLFPKYEDLVFGEVEERNPVSIPKEAVVRGA